MLEVRVSSKDVPVVRQRQAFLRTDELGTERLGRICSGRSSMLGEYKTQVLGPMTIHKGHALVFPTAHCIMQQWDGLCHCAALVPSENDVISGLGAL